MQIHYFQRYKTKENVATANTMLLLSRFYQYSPDKFFAYLRNKLFNDKFYPEIVFKLQEKTKENKDSVPDAVVSQPSFKVVVETKLEKTFKLDQLENHLKSFGNEEYKVLVTIAPWHMSREQNSKFARTLAEYNMTKRQNVRHYNTTFGEIAKDVSEYIDATDTEMQNVVDDFLGYCYNDNLIGDADAWRTLRMQLASTTFDINVEESVYHDNIERKFRPHDYLGLYKDKSLRAIGKLTATVLAVPKDGELEIKPEDGTPPNDYLEVIERVMEDARTRGEDLMQVPLRYFFVEKFYITDFSKTSSGAPMGTRIFDLVDILGNDALVDGKLPDTEEIAKMLADKEWD